MKVAAPINLLDSRTKGSDKLAQTGDHQLSTGEQRFRARRPFDEQNGACSAARRLGNMHTNLGVQ
jgi:hypothetical protein